LVKAFTHLLSPSARIARRRGVASKPCILFAVVALLSLAATLIAQTKPRPDAVEAAVARAVEIVLERQEGSGEAQWPYEGVYRVKGEIPIGYRIGGTAIAGMALLRAPGYDQDERRRAALRRAASFVAGGIEHPRMGHRFEARYDVRGWGYTYGLTFLLALRASERIPEGLAHDTEAAIRFYVDGLEATAIPQSGGWNYSRGAGFHEPGPAAPFMTAPTLQALFEAARQGYEVDGEIVRLGLKSLERARAPTGAFAYSGAATEGRRNAVPGAIGRMPAAEVTMYLAGRSDLSRIRGAIDAFLVHWQWLEDRRAKPGTHAGRYGIAPYYFYFAHLYAAQAVELLPAHERAEYRRRTRELLLATRSETGSWNDRVFPRSVSYGTSTAILSLMMAEAPPPARWEDGEPRSDDVKK